MTTSRAIWAGLGLLVALTAVNLMADRQASPNPTQPRRAPVDSSAVIVMHDTVRVLDSVSRRSLDSLREVFRRRPIRYSVEYLPGHVETLLVVDSVTVPEQVIRESADSLAACRHDRDSLTRDGSLWKARTASQDEARRICEAKPAPVQPEPPSRALWASVGASAAFLSILSIFILSR